MPRSSRSQARINSIRKAAGEGGTAGRMDVLLYNLVQTGAKTIEEKHGLAGLWDALEPAIVEGIGQTGLGRVEIPSEARMLFQLVRMGMTGATIPAAPGQGIQGARENLKNVEEVLAGDRLG